MRVTVAITGASGSIYAKRLIDRLSAQDIVETIYLVVSKSGRQVMEYETPGVYESITQMVKVTEFASDDFFTPIASGSNAAQAMVVVPCSMGTLARIAGGISWTLIERAADVQLKENLPLVMVMRETPLSLIHLKNMVAVKEAGATVMPASPSFYSKPQSIEELTDTVVERICAKILPKSEKSYRWAEK